MSGFAFGVAPANNRLARLMPLMWVFLLMWRSHVVIRALSPEVSLDRGRGGIPDDRSSDENQLTTPNNDEEANDDLLKDIEDWENNDVLYKNNIGTSK